MAFKWVTDWYVAFWVAVWFVVFWVAVWFVAWFVAFDCGYYNCSEWRVGAYERSSPVKVCCLMGKRTYLIQSTTYRMEFPDCIFNTQTLFFKTKHYIFSFMSSVPLHGYLSH